MIEHKKLKKKLIEKEKKKEDNLIFKKSCINYLSNLGKIYNENNWFELYCHEKEKETQKIKLKEENKKKLEYELEIRKKD